MSDLIIAYGEEVLHTSSGGDYGSYQSGAGELDGALLFRSRLSAPFERLELIYSVNTLPPGPGAEVLGWVSLVLGLVICSGFYALYRVGVSQIELARQQQDFVSAVKGSRIPPGAVESEIMLSLRPVEQPDYSPGMKYTLPLAADNGCEEMQQRHSHNLVDAFNPRNPMAKYSPFSLMWPGKARTASLSMLAFFFTSQLHWTKQMRWSI